MKSTIIVALDQHAATTVAAVLLPGQRIAALHSLTSDSATMLRFLERVRRQGPVRCCYEAGPCGFELQRALSADDMSKGEPSELLCDRRHRQARDPRARQLPTNHCHAVSTREDQSDSSSLPLGRSDPESTNNAPRRMACRPARGSEVLSNS